MTNRHTAEPWKVGKKTTPGQFVTDTVIRDKEESVIANMHVKADENAARIVACVNGCATLKHPEFVHELYEAATNLTIAREGSIPDPRNINAALADLLRALNKIDHGKAEPL
jgi:hypothetical protein